jgi:hypothetical protein
LLEGTVARDAESLAVDTDDESKILEPASFLAMQQVTVRDSLRSRERGQHDVQPSAQAIEWRSRRTGMSPLSS